MMGLAAVMRSGIGLMVTFSRATQAGAVSQDMPTNYELQYFTQRFGFSAALIKVDVADIKDIIDSLQIPSEVQHAVKEALRSFDFASAHSSL